MVFRAPNAAPVSRVAEQRRGALVGRFCHGCNQVFPLQRRMHSGDPIFGRDHVASPCPNEGYSFEPGADWWEPAVEVMPAPPEPDAAAIGASAPPPGSATIGPPPAPPAQPQTTSAPQQGQPAPQPPKS